MASARIGSRKSGKMTSFDPSETDYGYPLYTYGQYYGGYPLYRLYSSANASKSICCGVGTTVGLILQGQPKYNVAAYIELSAPPGIGFRRGELQDG